MPAALLDPTTYYQCDRCTACCRWPGDVKVTAEEVEKIAAYLEMGLEEFTASSTRLTTNRQGLSLLEKENHECLMLENGACKIHEVKPAQCRGFPNTWNFPNWQKVCHAKAVPIEEAVAQGLYQV